MRVPTSDRTQSISINMTPMIDVVFLLIIFFLVSSHLAKQEVQLELDLPTAASGQTQAEENRPRATINVLADGEVLLGSQRVDAEELARRLKVEVDSKGADLEIRIRSDRQVPYQFVEPIMLACSRAGAWNVTFAVTQGE